MSTSTLRQRPIPADLLRTVPVGATSDPELHARLDELAAGLPDSLGELDAALTAVQAYAEYDDAVNHAFGYIWPRLDELLHGTTTTRRALVAFARHHLAERARARIFRRLAKDANRDVRRTVASALRAGTIYEVALPPSQGAPWDAHGWRAGVLHPRLFKHAQGARVQKDKGVPKLQTVEDLRKLLGIRSAAQLGWLLTATDDKDGPYRRFTIPKRDGSDRTICAPKTQLRFVQRAILDEILSKIPTHDAAHGFIPGRSIVTNAAVHQGAKVVVKFDLQDFFPTIHYHRVLGLFTSLGYVIEDGRFSTDDGSRAIAPALARLCVYAEKAHAWGQAASPQGAPTSPAISNLVCRHLDARLDGLARANGGRYTRYADDLTFSFHGESPNLGRFRWWVDQICQQEGFNVHQGKYRVIRNSQQQRVTGVVVNDVLRVPRQERRRFRAILHNCRKHGVASQARGHKAFPEYLRGFASYVHMVHPDEGRRLLDEVNALLGTATSTTTP